MKKLPSKALLYRDFKSTALFIPLIFFELFLFFTQELIQYGDPIPFQINSLYQKNIILPYAIITGFTLILMSMSLFKYERNHHTYTLSTSMPFSRSEILMSKWLTGFYNIFISVTFYYVVLNAVLIKNFLWKMFFGEITVWYITLLLFILAFFSIILMVQSANGATCSGSFTTLLVIAFPFTFLCLSLQLIRPYFIASNEPIILPDFVERIIKAIISVFNFVYLITGIDLTEYGFSQDFIPIPYAKIIRWLLLLIIISLSFIISIKVFNKNQYEKTGQVTSISGIEKLYCFVIAYYIGYLAFNISYYLCDYPRIDFLTLFCFIIPVPLHYIVKFAFKKYNHRLV